MLLHIPNIVIFQKNNFHVMVEDLYAVDLIYSLEFELFTGKSVSNVLLRTYLFRLINKHKKS